MFLNNSLTAEPLLHCRKGSHKSPDSFFLLFESSDGFMLLFKLCTLSQCVYFTGWMEKKCFDIIHLILEFNMYLLIESTGREILLYTGKGQWNSYLAHRIIDSFPRILKWKIKILKSVLLAPRGLNPRLTNFLCFFFNLNIRCYTWFFWMA